MKVQNSTLIALTLQIMRRLFFKGAPNLFLQPGLFFKKYIFLLFFSKKIYLKPLFLKKKYI